MRIRLTRALEDGPTVVLILERTRPDATLQVSINGDTTAGSVAGRDLEDLEAALDRAMVGVLPGRSFVGLRDSNELTLEQGMVQATFYWAGPVPANWGPLEQIVSELLFLARTQRPSVRYAERR